VENFKETLDIIVYVIAIASSIVAITPTPKSGSVLSFVYKIIETAALVIFKAKQK
jgi:hypothetical protein